MTSIANKLPLEPPADGSRTLSDRAFWALHEAIVRGTLEPGDRLPIDELAQLFEMSPMPIREALRRLDAEGLAENMPHRGARVTGLSPEDLDEVYEARLALEPLAVRRAARRFDEKDKATASAALQRHQHAIKDGANEEMWAAHTDFHLALYRAGESTWLMRLITPLWQSSERYRHASGLVEWNFDARETEHAEILRACVDHDADAAASLLHDHLARNANEVSQRLGGEDLFKIAPARSAKRSKSSRSKG